MGFAKGGVWRAPRIITVVYATNAGILTAPSGALFVADAPYILEQVSEIHETLGTDGSAVTLDIVKCTGTQAASAGTSVLSSTFNLKATINTVVRKTQASGLVTTSSKAGLRLAAGDRFCAKFGGVFTSLTGVCVTLILHPFQKKGVN